MAVKRVKRATRVHHKHRNYGQNCEGTLVDQKELQWLLKKILKVRVAPKRV